MTETSPPFALFVRGPSARIFALSDDLGFETDMQALAVSVFEDGPDTMHVQALFTTEDEAKACQAALDLDGLEHFITQLPDEDWTAKSQAGLPPVEAGRFFIYGSHDADNIPEHATVPICINAGLAFGTGHHGTTTGCLLAFEALLDRDLNTKQDTDWPANILDLGCGAGVLAIAAAKALNRSVGATDIDMDAVDVTNDNARINGVAHLITASRADGIANEQKYDLIFANILAKPLMLMAPDIAGALAGGGVVILSGLLDEQAQDMITCYETQGLKLIRRASLKGWTTLSMGQT
ncbi:MAG: 50S ribosomal protein L11 methyltransferase [Robiginitomaculum sp.]|nr:50S ribosomal protein L11 methyltransferase [Robiginitomaculum sp.]